MRTTALNSCCSNGKGTIADDGALSRVRRPTSVEVVEKRCHDMRFESCECGKKRLRRGSVPHPTGELTASPDPIAGQGRGGEGTEKEVA